MESGLDGLTNELKMRELDHEWNRDMGTLKGGCKVKGKHGLTS